MNVARIPGQIASISLTATLTTARTATLTAALTAALAAALACGGGAPSGNDPRDPGGDARVSVLWDGRSVEWGAPESLRATLSGAPEGAEIVWRSLDDFYLGQPVVLGRGPAITTAVLKPGTTTVEAAIVAGSRTLARDAASVTVGYRESWNVSLEGHVPYPAGTVGDVWVTQGHALVARRSAGGISIVDLDGAIREVGRFTAPGLFTQDVKATGPVAFVSHEGNTYPNSVTVLDLADPANPRQIAAISRVETPTAHNLWIDESTLYVAAPFVSRLIHAYDVTDPGSPRPLSTLASTNGSAHDIHVRDGIVFGSFLPLKEGQIGELVLASSDVLAPFSFTTYGGAFTHSSWLSMDGRYLYVADEVLNAPIRIFDVSNPGSPVRVGAYQPRLGTIPHNFQVRDGRHAFLAHYKHGVEIVDVSEPAAPRLVGFYDTYPGAQADVAGAGAMNVSSAMALTRDVCEEHCLSLSRSPTAQSIFDGAWGVHWTDDGRIVASDMASGLYVLRFTP
ncbi:MAG TPA: hypothetical protein VM737_06615 [Gemmatimonadota bacterium]|nr:hypothetical protein [Gemmatimonadota bacterium]